MIACAFQLCLPSGRSLRSASTSSSNAASRSSSFTPGLAVMSHCAIDDRQFQRLVVAIHALRHLLFVHQPAYSRLDLAAAQHGQQHVRIRVAPA